MSGQTYGEHHLPNISPPVKSRDRFPHKNHHIIISGELSPPNWSFLLASTWVILCQLALPSIVAIHWENGGFGTQWIDLPSGYLTVRHGKSPFLRTVNHLFRLGPSKNHGELLVITSDSPKNSSTARR